MHRIYSFSRATLNDSYSQVDLFGRLRRLATFDLIIHVRIAATEVNVSELATYERSMN